MGTAVRKIDTNKSVAEIFEIFKDEKYPIPPEIIGIL